MTTGGGSLPSSMSAWLFGLQESGEGVEKSVLERGKAMISCLPKATRVDRSIESLENNILPCWHYCAWLGLANTAHRPVGHRRVCDVVRNGVNYRNARC